MAVNVSVAPKGMGLNDFVAMQEGYFRDEGLDVEFDMKTFRGTQSSWKDLQYFGRPQDRPFSLHLPATIRAAALRRRHAPAPPIMIVDSSGQIAPETVHDHGSAGGC